MLRAELLQFETAHTFPESFKAQPGCSHAGNQISNLSQQLEAQGRCLGHCGRQCPTHPVPPAAPHRQWVCQLWPVGTCPGVHAGTRHRVHAGGLQGEGGARMSSGNQTACREGADEPEDGTRVCTALQMKRTAQRKPMPVNPLEAGERQRRGVLAGGQGGTAWLSAEAKRSAAGAPEGKLEAGGAGGTQGQGAGRAEGCGQAAPSQTGGDGVRLTAPRPFGSRWGELLAASAPTPTGRQTPWGIRRRRVSDPAGSRGSRQGKGQVTLLPCLGTARSWGGEAAHATHGVGEGRRHAAARRGGCRVTTGAHRTGHFQGTMVTKLWNSRELREMRGRPLSAPGLETWSHPGETAEVTS